MHFYLFSHLLFPLPNLILFSSFFLLVFFFLFLNFPVHFTFTSFRDGYFLFTAPISFTFPILFFLHCDLYFFVFFVFTFSNCFQPFFSHFLYVRLPFLKFSCSTSSFELSFSLLPLSFSHSIFSFSL